MQPKARFNGAAARHTKQSRAKTSRKRRPTPQRIRTRVPRTWGGEL